jgi:predicted nucleic acid-binding protein
MSTYVVDASIGIKLFLDEEFAEEVERLFASETTLLVPDLFFIECTNILWKRVARGLYPLADAQENIAELDRLHLPATATATLMRRAFVLACQYGATAYDACYLALAEQQGVPLLTADAPLCQALAGSPITVLTMPEYLAIGT